jgi:hypothetical protein
MPSFQVVYQVGYEIIDGIKKVGEDGVEDQQHQHSKN